MPIRKFVVATSVFCMGLLFSHCAAQADPSPEDLGRALAEVVWDGNPPPDGVAVMIDGCIDEYKELPAAFARGEPNYLDELYSAALLAQTAEHPATRAAMYDITRYILAHAVMDETTNPMLVLWNKIDPAIERQQMGVWLTESDIAAAEALEELGDPPSSSTRERLMEAWAENAESDPNRFLLTRLDAWTAGVLGNADSMTSDQFRQAASMTYMPDVPDQDTVRAVTGSNDLIAWLSGLDFALTDAERAAHPELMEFLNSGSAVGPMVSLLQSIAQNPGNYPMVDYGSYMMMFRMNNYMIGGGSMGDWQAGAAMNGWQ